jgi:hypothetical protein
MGWSDAYELPAPNVPEASTSASKKHLTPSPSMPYSLVTTWLFSKKTNAIQIIEIGTKNNERWNKKYPKKMKLPASNSY